MIDTKFLDDLAKKLSNAMPSGLKDIKKDLEQNFKAILQAAFNKLDLVTRHEFSVQSGVLTRTRAKLDALEKQVTELEKKMKPATKKSPKK
jgi:BMFP domain-containing protein YqiC